MNATTAPKVGMISLGCAKNLVDAEIMLGGIVKEGMQITSDADEADDDNEVAGPIAIAVDLAEPDPATSPGASDPPAP